MVRLTGRTLMAPVVAFTAVSVAFRFTSVSMLTVQACVVYAYTRSSIHAAKMEVADRRRRDGGGLDLRRESLRKRGIDPDTYGANAEEQALRDAMSRRH